MQETQTGVPKRTAQKCLGCDEAQKPHTGCIYDLNYKPIEQPKQSIDIEKLFADLPKKEDSIYLLGQHGKSEPLAANVGKKLAEAKKAKNLPITEEQFPEGMDRDGDIKKGYEEMARIANEHSKQTVINFHEGKQAGNLRNTLIINFFCSPRLKPEAIQNMKSFFAIIREKLETNNIRIDVNFSNMRTLERVDEKDTTYNKVPINMLVLEVMTPEDLYEKLDEEKNLTAGNMKFKTDTDSARQIKDLEQRYIDALSVLIPVINAEYSKYQSSDFDLSTIPGMMD